ncbi:MAG: uL15m family ribosomal protein [Candidatus Pacearchaeota archaeon]
MPLQKTKKKKKSVGMRGRGMGTHGGGARKKRKKSGHHGGGGMSGSGKRGDQKKTLITKLYGNTYFGKKGVTSRKTQRDTRKRIGLRDIETNIESYVKKGIAKKKGDGFEINLKSYKILSSSKDYSVKNKLIINAKDASKSAEEKVKKAGGQLVIPVKREKKEGKEKGKTDKKPEKGKEEREVKKTKDDKEEGKTKTNEKGGKGIGEKGDSVEKE